MGIIWPSEWPSDGPRSHQEAPNQQRLKRPSKTAPRSKRLPIPYGKHIFLKIRLKNKLQGPSNCPPRELPRRLHRDPGDAAFTTSPRANGNNGRNAAWAGGMSEAIEVIMNAATKNAVEKLFCWRVRASRCCIARAPSRPISLAAQREASPPPLHLCGAGRPRRPMRATGRQAAAVRRHQHQRRDAPRNGGPRPSPPRLGPTRGCTAPRKQGGC